MAETYNKYRNYLMQYYTQNPNLGVIEHYKKNPVGYKAFETLHYVASQLGRSFNIFVPVVNSIIVDYNY